MSARAKGLAAVILAAVFVVGLLTGVVLEDSLEDVDWPTWLGGEDDRGDDDVEDILADLDLTAAQDRQIEAILERREEWLEDYWAEQLPELRAIVDSSYTQIRAVLTPEQRTVFDRRSAGIRARIDIDDDAGD